jgi:hypothetical protein
MNNYSSHCAYYFYKLKGVTFAMWAIFHSNNVLDNGNDFIFETKKKALEVVLKASGDVVTHLRTIEDGVLKFGYGEDSYYLLHKDAILKKGYKNIWNYLENKQEQINEMLRDNFPEYV